MLHEPGTSSVANLLALSVRRDGFVSNDQKRSKSRVLVPVVRPRGPSLAGPLLAVGLPRPPGATERAVSQRRRNVGQWRGTVGDGHDTSRPPWCAAG